MTHLFLLLSLLSASADTSGQTISSLPRSTPEAEGVDSAGMLALVNGLKSKIDAVHSMMQVPHGKVVTEGWRAPYTSDGIHIKYSVSRSFTSTTIRPPV